MTNPDEVAPIPDDLKDKTAPIPDDLRELHKLYSNAPKGVGYAHVGVILIERLAQAEQRAAKAEALLKELNLPDENDPMCARIVKSGTFSSDPEIAKTRKGGTIGDWMRLAKKAEAERDAFRASWKANEKGLYQQGLDLLAENTRLRETLKSIKAYCHGEEEVNGFSEISDIARKALEVEK